MSISRNSRAGQQRETSWRPQDRFCTTTRVGAGLYHACHIDACRRQHETEISEANKRHFAHPQWWTTKNRISLAVLVILITISPPTEQLYLQPELSMAVSSLRRNCPLANFTGMSSGMLYPKLPFSYTRYSTKQTRNYRLPETCLTPSPTYFPFHAS